MLGPGKTGSRRCVPGSQQGVTLIELMVAMVISLVVSGAMLMLLASTLGSSTRVIGMTNLTQQMRAAMQIMSRDVRRANYHANYVRCFGNLDCRSTNLNQDDDKDTDRDASAYIKAVTITTGGDCFYYWFDRDNDGDVTNDDAVGGFRLGSRNSVGTIEMTTTLNTSPNCDANTDWTAITDPAVVDVTSFVIDKALSFTDVITSDGATQTVEKVRIRMTAELVSDSTINRTIEDVIRVRNDVYTMAP